METLSATMRQKESKVLIILGSLNFNSLISLTIDGLGQPKIQALVLWLWRVAVVGEWLYLVNQVD